MNIAKFSRILLIVFSVYIVLAFAQKYLPKSPRESLIFVFLFLLNAGVHSGCLNLLKISNDWQKKIVILLQIIFTVWSVYNFRFAFESAYTGDKVHLILDTPLQQWGILLIAFIIIIVTNKEHGS